VTNTPAGALRSQLEAEVRAAVADAHAQGHPVDSLLLVGTVLERHQHREEVQGRIEFLWSYLEAYVALLESQSREP
jgi:hypothetical protein